ncbi:MAG TPA: 4-hydroxythreonine-4-phosphate dehydrogenase [Roseiarcus sp.]|nr:4-hydroxythreonine-4-phosphate dehydrogenase [Roseiarcus sp.]
MDFVFMLTRDDATVPDALALVEVARDAGVAHIGFKDVGADAATLKGLAAAIGAAGASVWMEVVATSRDEEFRSIALGRDLGVDWLMGGTHVDEALAVLAGSATGYLPFAGRPVGHPTKLGGSADEVEAQCRAFASKGCAGADILAYRATDAAPLDLVAACRKGLGEGGKLVVAGSVNGPERVAAVRAAGADAFTVGTAAIEGAYAPGAGPLSAQLKVILADCGRAA